MVAVLSNPSPIKGASTVVWRDGCVLLILRSRGPFAGIWSLPGGKLEAGETYAEAASRELREETGIMAEIGPLLRTFEIEADDPEPARYMLHTFRGTFVSGKIKAGDDAADARWVPAAELGKLNLTPQSRDAIALSQTP